MRLPPIIVLLGYAGLVPFLVAPAWLALAPASAPAWLDGVWIDYVALIAAFLAGTFWGFALPAMQGPAGVLGALIATFLMLATWAATAVPFATRLYALALVFLLLLVADFWRERTLDTLPGYFALRSTLTAGALVGLAGRLLLGDFPA